MTKEEEQEFFKEVERIAYKEGNTNFEQAFIPAVRLKRFVELAIYPRLIKPKIESLTAELSAARSELQKAKEEIETLSKHKEGLANDLQKAWKDRDEALEGLRLQLLFSNEWGPKIENFSDTLAEQSSLLEQMAEALKQSPEGVYRSYVTAWRGIRKKALASYETYKGKQS